MRNMTGCNNNNCIEKDNCKRFIYNSIKKMLFTPIHNTKEKFKCDTYLKEKQNEK